MSLFNNIKEEERLKLVKWMFISLFLNTKKIYE